MRLGMSDCSFSRRVVVADAVVVVVVVVVVVAFCHLFVQRPQLVAKDDP